MKKFLIILLSAFFMMPITGMCQNTDMERHFPVTLNSGTASILHLGNDKALIVESSTGVIDYHVSFKSFWPEWLEYDGMATCCEDGQGGLFALFEADWDMSEPKTYLVHFSADGQVTWSSLFVQRVSWGWTHLAADGNGGVYLVHKSFDNYKHTIVRYFSADGTCRWKKVLAVQDLVLKPYFASSDIAGSFRLYATTVSKSKNTYTTLELVIGMEGDILLSEAREFPNRKDYSAALINDLARREVYFYSEPGYLDTCGTKELLLPLSALEVCETPEILFNIANQDVH